MTDRRHALFLLAATGLLAAAGRLVGDERRIPPPDLQAAVERAAEGGEKLYRQALAEPPPETLSSRALFTYALALCEAGRDMERLERLFDLARQMQDRDPGSPSYGNFRWYWRDAGVADYNAVQFCMQAAIPLWLLHREQIPPPARQTLRALIERGAEGVLRHDVPTSYTNIAILDAANLLLLGEILERDDLAEEGQRRLDALCLWTWLYGTHEYCSPTYYAVNLTGLERIERFSQSDRARSQARALLTALWTDVAANWHVGAGRLAGTQSRSYDYVSGLGILDLEMWKHGLLETAPPRSAGLIQHLVGRWELPDDVRAMFQLPQQRRTVRQSWGVTLVESRTHVMYSDISLSTSAAAYGPTDMPLTVDLPGDRTAARCYFIADGRGDPYGKVRYATGSAGHPKALHLKPFWTAAQQGRDALALVLYRPEDLPADSSADVATGLQSHFVMRRDADGWWIGGKPVALPPAASEEPARLAVAAGQSVVARWGAAAVGVKVLWAADGAGGPASAALVDDGNPYGAVRLSIDHRRTSRPTPAGAVLWVRIGSGLSSDDAFGHWLDDFEQRQPTRAEVDLAKGRIAFAVKAHSGGPVALEAAAPFGEGEIRLTPAPTRLPLEVDGRDLVRPLLDELEPIRSLRVQQREAAAVHVPREKPVIWEAEDGVRFPGMEIAEDPSASGGAFLWCPAGDRVRRWTAVVQWPLEVREAGDYYLWARTIAPDAQSDSFFVRMVRDSASDIPFVAWHVPRTSQWQWHPVRLEGAVAPTALSLAAGRHVLEFRVREAGTRIDRLAITRDPVWRPEP